MRTIARLLLLISATFSIAAFAGYKQYMFTTVNLADGYAYAAMGQARYNTRENNSDFGFLRCQFVDSVTISCNGFEQANNASFQCSANAVANPGFARNVRALNSASFFVVYFDPGTQVCTDMRLIQGSQFLPDAHGPVPAVSTVTLQGGRAHGALGGVRYNGANTNEIISCDIWASGYIYCFAQDQSNAVKSCATMEAWNPALAEAVRSIDSISSVTFTFDAASFCTSVLVDKNSNWLP